MTDLISSNANKFDYIINYIYIYYIWLYYYSFWYTDGAGCDFAVPMDMYCSTDPDGHASSKPIPMDTNHGDVSGMSHPPDEQLFDRFEGV